MADTDKQRDYIKREKEIRAKNINSRAGGTPLIYPEDQMIGVMIQKGRPVSTEMQHCIIKVYRKLPGTEKERYISAFNICAAVFIKNGYQTGMKLTGKGQRNEFRHRSEVDAGFKEQVYNGLRDRLWKGAMNMAANPKKQTSEKSEPKGKSAKQKAESDK